MLLQYQQVLEWVAKVIFYRFPDRPDRRLSLGDCCLFTGDCPGHPAGSHRDKRVFDQNYYTFRQTNTTQYRSGFSGKDTEYDKVSIWTNIKNSTDSFSAAGGRLNPDAFDWERNYEFWRLIHLIFPRSRIMIHDEMRQLIQRELRKRFRHDEANALLKFTQTTKGNKWNHHTHAHVDLGTIIDWEFVYDLL